MSKMAQLKVVGGRQMICFPDGAQFYLMRNARKYAKRKGFVIPKVNPSSALSVEEEIKELRAMAKACWREAGVAEYEGDTPSQERAEYYAYQYEAEAERLQGLMTRANPARADASFADHVRAVTGYEIEGIPVGEYNDLLHGTQVVAGDNAALVLMVEPHEDEFRELSEWASAQSYRVVYDFPHLPRLPHGFVYASARRDADGNLVLGVRRVRYDNKVGPELGPFTLKGDKVVFYAKGSTHSVPATLAGMREAVGSAAGWATRGGA